MTDPNISEFRKYLENPPTQEQELSDADVAGFDVTSAPLDPLATYRALRFKGVDPNQMGVVKPQMQAPLTTSMVSPETLGGRILRKSPQIAGGTIGGAIGAVIPTLGEEATLAAGGSMAGNYLLAPLFAALGGAGGRMTTLRPDDPKYAKKLLYAGLEEGLGELGGRLLSAAGGRLLRPFRRSVEPGAVEANKVLINAGKYKDPKTLPGKVRDAARGRFFGLKEYIKNTPGGDIRAADTFGAHVLPGQSTESFMDTIQGLCEGSFVSGGKLRRFGKQRIPRALQNAAETLKQSVRRNVIEQVGEKHAAAIFADISNADAATINAIEKGLYEAIDKLNKAPGDISAISNFAKSELGKGLKGGGRETILRRAAKIGEKSGGTETFENLRVMRRDARQAQQMLLKKGANVDARIMGQLAETIDGTMESIAKKSGPETYTAFRAADTFHRGKLRTEWLENTLIKTSQADEAPGRKFVNKITEMATEANNKPSKLARMGFTPDEIERIKGIANAAVFARKKAEGGGRMLIQLAQGGALIQIGGGLLAAGGAAGDSPTAMWTGVGIMVAPEVMARMMLNKTGAKLLTEGLRMPVGSRTVGALSTRILREASYHAMKIREEGGDGRIWFMRRDPVSKKEMARRKKVEQVEQAVKKARKAEIKKLTEPYSPYDITVSGGL